MKIDEYKGRFSAVKIKNDGRIGSDRFSKCIKTDIERRTNEVGKVVHRLYVDDKKTITVQFVTYYGEGYGFEYQYDEELGEWRLFNHQLNGTLFEYNSDEEIKDIENNIKSHTEKIANLNVDIHLFESQIIDIKHKADMEEIEEN